MSGYSDATTTKNHFAEAEQKLWECLAITLDPEGKRYQTFLENNNHLEIKTFQGIKGRDLQKEEIVNQGLATEDLVFSALLKYGLVGNAASHRAIWRRVIKENRCFLILEDDCYTHPRVADFINDKLMALMNFDICFLGINTDSILQSISPVGLNMVTIFDPKHPNEKWIRDAFSKTCIEEVALHRLIKSFGYCAYFISPTGAKKLSTEIFPLSLATTNIPLVSNKMPATSVDRAANSVYSKLQTFVCQPFLAYTPNTDSQTTE